MQINWQQDAGSLILPLRGSRLKLSRMTQNQLLLWTGGAVCGNNGLCAWLTIGMHNKSTKVARECWRLPETASSIVHHFPLLFLPSRHHATIYTQRIIQVFLLAAGCDWLSDPNMAKSDWLTAWERRELWKGRPRVKAVSQIMGVFLLKDNVHLEYDADFSVWVFFLQWCTYENDESCVRFSIKVWVIYLFS